MKKEDIVAILPEVGDEFICSACSKKHKIIGFCHSWKLKEVKKSFSDAIDIPEGNFCFVPEISCDVNSPECPINIIWVSSIIKTNDVIII